MNNNLLIGVAILVILLIPIISSQILVDVVDSLIGRIVLLGLVVFAIRQGPLAGILTFLAVAAIFAERNRFRIQKAQNLLAGEGSQPGLGNSSISARLADGGKQSVPAPTTPDVQEKPWLSYGLPMESETLNYTAPESSEDEKVVLKSQLFPNDRINQFYLDHDMPSHN